MTMDEITSIKKQTRLALPKDDSYLYRLGIALYGTHKSACHQDSLVVCNIKNFTQLMDKAF